MQLATIDDAFALLESRGGGAYGLAAVSQLEHALQSALIAAEEGFGPSLIIAALFHDIGHLAVGENVALADDGVDDLHEISGANILAPLFGPEVVEPIRLHVPAKRWLCAVEPDYFGKLAPDSVRSLQLEGGPMTNQEASAFAALPHAGAGIALRRIDDQAKVPGLRTPGLAAYREMAIGL